MTDEQAAEMMKAKLQGQEKLLSFVGYTCASGVKHCVSVIGSGPVRIPRDTVEAWFGWHPDVPSYKWFPTSPHWQMFPQVAFFNQAQQSVHISYE